VLVNDWLVFNTSKGKDLQGLMRAVHHSVPQLEVLASIMKILRKLRIMISLVVTQ